MKKNSAFLFLSLFCGVVSGVPEFRRLLDDMDCYKTFGKSAHRMHLLGHSLAVGQRLEHWLAGHIDWGQKNLFLDEPIPHNGDGAWWGAKLSAGEKRSLAFAGYVHDIGKAGDSMYQTYMLDGMQVDASAGKLDHEFIGFYYALYHANSKKNREKLKQHLIDAYAVPGDHLHAYYMVAGNHGINFLHLTERLGFVRDDFRLITVLIGAHKLLGRVFNADEQLCQYFEKKQCNKKHATLSPEDFLVVLADLVRMAGLPDTRVDESLVHMIVALTLADLQSVYYPVQWMPSEFNDVNCFEKAVKARRDFFVETHYLINGKKVDEAHARAWACEKVAMVAKNYEKKIVDILKQNIVHKT